MAVKDIWDAVLGYDRTGVTALVEKEIDAGTSVEDILDNGLIAALDEVGKRFSAGELFVPEMLMAAQTMKTGLALLKPHLTATPASSKGTVVIGTVKGDLHDIGKNLVVIMMEGAGFTVVDLGVDVSTGRFVSAAKQHAADVVALSALLTTTMKVMDATIEAIRKDGLSARTLIGGAPVTQAFADQIGADGYSDNAPGAVEIARKLIAEVRD